MEAATGISNHLSATVPAPSGSVPQRNTASSGGMETGSTAATITANDFLTLLVTEMKNQDPTAATDPNEYINQLVQVNSLQQLISINQTLLADSQGLNTEQAKGNAGATIHIGTTAPLNEALGALGSYTIPPPSPAAQNIAHALSGVPPGA